MKAIVVAFLSTIVLSGAASAAEIKVIGSPGFREAYTDLLPGFETSAGHRVTTIWGGVNEVAKRVADGEMADIVILPAAQIDDLIRRGKLAPETRVDVAKSSIGVAIRMGAPKIDAASSDGIRKALLAAKSIAYSSGPSGVHMADVIEKWGLAAELKAKIKISPPNTPVGVMIERGDAEIGFQQVSELVRIKGIDYLGALPAEIDEVTVFSAAVHRNASASDAAKALVRYLSAPEAAPVIRRTGMDPG
jgi:molybdate transport system substrate-binding protein